MKALTLKQIDATIVDIAHWSKSIQAQDECQPGPSLCPQFLIELIEELQLNLQSNHLKATDTDLTATTFKSDLPHSDESIIDYL